MIPIDILLLGSGILLILGILFSKLSANLNVPSLIVFLVIGILLGSDGIVGIYFDNYVAVQYISIFALIIIIFAGGLDSDYDRMKSIFPPGLSLSIIGVFITAFLVGYLIHIVLGYDLLFSLLIGSIISSTDAAAVFSIFRTSELKLTHHLDDLLELESATNDPVAYVLTTSFIYLILNPATSTIDILIIFFQSLILGFILGYIFGQIATYVLNNIKLKIDGLYPVLMIAFAIITFGFSELVGGNGFLAIYIAALLIGNNLIHKKDLHWSFIDGLSWLMQSIMFIILGLLAFPSQTIKVVGTGLIVSFLLIVIARPIAVFISLQPFKYDFKSKLFLSWSGIKGAIPIVFATYPFVAGIEGASLIFNIIFFVTVFSVLLQGSTVKTLAEKLNLIESEED